MQSHRSATVKINEIDIEDLSFSVGDPNPDDGLKESVRRTGIVNPPVLFLKKDNTHAVVSGHRRLRAALDAGISQITSFILEGTPADAMVAAITDHSFNRSLSAADKAALAKRALDIGITREDLLRDIMPLLGLKPSEDLLDKLLFLGGLGGQPGADIVSLSAVPYLARLGIEDASAALELFDTLKPGTNFQKEILSLTEEIALRENTSAAGVLRDACKNLPEGSRGQKITAVRNTLVRRRYPSVTAHEEEFARIARDIDAGPDVTWRHEEAFENPEITVNFSFTGKETFERIIKKLFSASTEGFIDKLVRICNGRKPPHNKA